MMILMNHPLLKNRGQNENTVRVRTSNLLKVTIDGLQPSPDVISCFPIMQIIV